MKVLRFRASLLALMLSAVPAAAAPNIISLPCNCDQIAVPADSPLHVSGVKASSLATFQGRVLLTGTYSYGDGKFNDSDEFLGEAELVPDAATLARLPHFVIRNNRYSIGLRNPETFANKVIPKNILAQVRRKHGGYATGYIAIWADRFTAEIVCDGPSYGVRFLAVYRPPALKLAQNGPQIGC